MGGNCIYHKIFLFMWVCVWDWKICHGMNLCAVETFVIKGKLKWKIKGSNELSSIFLFLGGNVNKSNENIGSNRAAVVVVVSCRWWKWNWVRKERQRAIEEMK
jgi:hypothetical protein